MQGICTFRMETLARPRPDPFHTHGVHGAAHMGMNGADDDDDDDAFARAEPLFRLVVGVAPSSDGLACAKDAGVPEAVLRRALEVKHAISARTAVRAVAAVGQAGDDALADPAARALLLAFLAGEDWGAVEGADAVAALADLKKQLT